MQTSISTQRCAFGSYHHLGEAARSWPKRSEAQGRDGLHRGLWGAASLMLIWAALWWVLLEAYQHPKLSACGAGQIELGGACVLGEEILVGAPDRIGWSGR